MAVKDSQLAGGGKLKPKYKGPYTVHKVLQNDRYVVQDLREGYRNTTTVMTVDNIKNG